MGVHFLKEQVNSFSNLIFELSWKLSFFWETRGFFFTQIFFWKCGFSKGFKKIEFASWKCEFWGVKSSFFYPMWDLKIGFFWKDGNCFFLFGNADFLGEEGVSRGQKVVSAKLRTLQKTQKLSNFNAFIYYFLLNKKLLLSYYLVLFNRERNVKNPRW